jgi:hypothetical protein
MITQVEPTIKQQSTCPHCSHELRPISILWHGMHICIESECIGCFASIIEDLRVGHAIHYAYQLDLKQGKLFGNGNQNTEKWLGKPLLKSLQNPEEETLTITKKVLKDSKRIIILNCIDYLYGHCLLKLLNAQRHLEKHKDYGLVVVVPSFLEWIVPKGVAEIWTIQISLREGQLYYPCINTFILKECKRFDEVYVSEAYSHPSCFNITNFTGVPKHNFDEASINIVFIWREDRLWVNRFLEINLVKRFISKFNLYKFALPLQNCLIKSLFRKIRANLPFASFVVVGLGVRTRFPAWITDLRVDKFDEEAERKLCQIYSQSRLVIGVHGSNMLLPSAHAGMTIDLMPDNCWGNVIQDILYQEIDPRIASFRYRYVPIQTSTKTLSKIALSMLLSYPHFYQYMKAD